MDRRAHWGVLPPLAITEILSYLRWTDRLHAASSCKYWYTCFYTPVLWRKFTFSFLEGRSTDHSLLLSKHGNKMKDIAVLVDQSDERNRKSACDVILELARAKLSVLKFSIVFMSENPLFYSGLDFMRVLTELFRSVNSLLHVDLSGLDLNIEDAFLAALYVNNPSLKSLNVDNKSIPTLISSICITNLMKTCRDLEQLRLRHASISDECFEALLESNHGALKKLFISCNRQEKFTRDIHAESWDKLSKQFPKLRVAFHFDHMCLLNKISDILKPEIKVDQVYFMTYTRIHEELDQVVRQYAATLEVLAIDAQSSPELDDSLKHAAAVCRALKTVKLFCSVDASVLSAFLNVHQNDKDFRLVLE